jgi:hypothetical protein
MRKILLLVIATALLIEIGESHVRLNNPPARQTAWREFGTIFPINYNDFEMFCGGFVVQWNQNGIFFV